MKRPDIWLGDLARALGALHPSQPSAVAKLFGFGPGTAPELAPRPTSKPSSASARASFPPSDPEPDHEEEEDASDGHAASGVTEVESLGTDARLLARSEWSSTGEPLALPAEVAHPREFPLVVPRRRRGVVIAAASTQVAEGPIDLRAVVNAIASRRPMAKLARRPVPTARRGAHLLVDMGESMLPFAPDRTMLVEAISETLGRSRVSVSYFAGCPSRGAGSKARFTWKPFTLPRLGVPLVLLTDLGAGGPELSEDRADELEWQSFLREARAGGCPVVVFTPYLRSRHGPDLASLATLVHWDRTSTAASVRRAVGLGLRVPR